MMHGTQKRWRDAAAWAGVLLISAGGVFRDLPAAAADADQPDVMWSSFGQPWLVERLAQKPAPPALPCKRPVVIPVSGPLASRVAPPEPAATMRGSRGEEASDHRVLSPVKLEAAHAVTASRGCQAPFKAAPELSAALDPDAEPQVQIEPTPAQGGGYFAQLQNGAVPNGGAATFSDLDGTVLYAGGLAEADATDAAAPAADASPAPADGAKADANDYDAGEGSGEKQPAAGATASPTPSQDSGTMDEDSTATPKPSPADQEAVPAAPQVEPEQTPAREPEEQQSEHGEPLSPALVAANIPLPTNPPLPLQYSEWDLAQVESPLFLNAAVNEFNERPLLLTGKWSVKPHLSISSYYDGNIFLSSHGAQDDFIVRIAPGLAMRLGDDDSPFYFTADYTAGFNIYSEHSSESTVDQDVRAQFQWSLPKTTFDLDLGVSADTGQSVDVSDRVRRELYSAGLSVHHEVGDKTSWDLEGDYSRSDYNGLISSREYDASYFFNYQYSPKTQIGVGGGGGYLTVPGQSGQIYEQAELRTTYRATGKLTLIGGAGLEVMEYQGGLGDTMTPIFSIEAAWAPRAGTEADITLRRTIYASAILNNQDYTATSIDFALRQRITDYVSAALAGGYVNAGYTATASGVNATREDNYFYVRPEVEWKALTWMSVGIFYEYSQDLSSGGVANNFTRDRGGIDIAILF